MGERKYDFIILGASGFTGQFVVEEVGRICKEVEGLKFAIAGRNKTKLEEVLIKAKENTHNLDFSDVNIIVADVNDEESLVSMAKQGKVVINCVGPYRYYGLKVVEACLEGGADHIDISGEPQYLEEAQLKFSEKAKEKGIHVVGACGFDSIPADMGTIFLQNNFNGDVNSVEMIVGFDDSSEGSAAINVTTLECALSGYASRKDLGKIRRELFKEKLPKSSHRSKQRGTLWWSDEASRWCLPNLASDRSVVMRTQDLNFKLSNRRPIQFNAFFGMTSVWTAIGSIMFGIIFAAMAPFAFTRNLFLKFPSVFSFGAFSREGAKREDLKDLRFAITLVAHGWDTFIAGPEEQHSDPPKVKKIAKVIGPDPGYFGTAIILTQAALTIILEKEKLPSKGGVFTPGSAFLQTSLIERLAKKGIEFKMVE